MENTIETLKKKLAAEEAQLEIFKSQANQEMGRYMGRIQILREYISEIDSAAQGDVLDAHPNLREVPKENTA